MAAELLGRERSRLVKALLWEVDDILSQEPGSRERWMNRLGIADKLASEAREAYEREAVGLARAEERMGRTSYGENAR